MTIVKLYKTVCELQMSLPSELRYHLTHTHTRMVRRQAALCIVRQVYSTIGSAVIVNVAMSSRTYHLMAIVITATQINIIVSLFRSIRKRPLQESHAFVLHKFAQICAHAHRQRHSSHRTKSLQSWRQSKFVWWEKKVLDGVWASCYRHRYRQCAPNVNWNGFSRFFAPHSLRWRHRIQYGQLR